MGHLRWLCRRGMKELDVLLEGFLEREGTALAAGQFPGLERLLASEDDRLWGWFQQRELAPPEFTDLVKAIHG
jgi:antitoxin CptB